ncbi:ChaC-like protein-domain-containing protein [Kalaharituber pfeilii]|nr:ChaC-like protein-domain-containing protein [Kalaharituber pfeilii]
MTIEEKTVSNDQILNSNNEFWIFGYGSLIWKPPPDFDRRVPGYIEGYVRRFWQVNRNYSEDHRGTPENPGRVVTLIERSLWDTLMDHHSVDDTVWGIAYRIESSKVENVKEYLDIREINGYSVHQVDVHQSTPNSPTIKAIVYIGTPTNPQFVGNPPPNAEELARHIYHSRGPSGENRDYLYQLHKSLLELCPESSDNHVSDLQHRVSLIEKTDRMESHENRKPISQTDGTNYQEEVEKLNVSG